MNEAVNQPLILRKKSKSSRFASWSGDANHFYDKLLRAIYISLLFIIDLVMFVYSINAKLYEDGVFNQAVVVIAAGIFAVAFVLILLLSFSKDAQNALCAIITMVMVACFFYQFALFNVDTFVEDWLEKRAGWLTFVGIIPGAWFVGLICAIIVFFAFRSTFVMLFVCIVLLSAGGIGIKKNEEIIASKDNYSEVKGLSAKAGQDRTGNLIYFMLPKFPSYQLLSNVNDYNFRELRDLILGFYAINNFEIYPNAFVKKDDTVSNMIDIFNQVDYTNSSSGNRSYAEFINTWDFVHGTLDYYSLEDNLLYKHLWDNGYGISTYAMPGFNICLKSGKVNTDRCVIKNYKTVPIYDKTKSVEQNAYAILSEWILSLKVKSFNSIAKTFANMSPLKGIKVSSENRRVSFEGAPTIFDELIEDFKKDNGGQIYMVYVDLPSDIYMYDEFCNLKPRKDWLALQDNSLQNGGIDEKRKAYADQAKCVIGRLQEFMDTLGKSDKNNRTDVIIQGVSPIPELSGMMAGKYGNFVKNQLVNLAIRKGKKPKFLINANICLASDFTKTLIRYQDYCYSIDNMKLPTKEALSLKQNLINNSIVRGSKISNIAANYRDWYEFYKANATLYQKRLEAYQQKVNAEKEKNDREKYKEGIENEDNVAEGMFLPSDSLILEFDEKGEMKPIKNSDEEVSSNIVSGKKNVPTDTSLQSAASAQEVNVAPVATSSQTQPAASAQEVNVAPVATSSQTQPAASAQEVNVAPVATSSQTQPAASAQEVNVAPVATSSQTQPAASAQEVNVAPVATAPQAQPAASAQEVNVAPVDTSPQTQPVASVQEVNVAPVESSSQSQKEVTDDLDKTVGTVAIPIEDIPTLLP